MGLVTAFEAAKLEHIGAVHPVCPRKLWQALACQVRMGPCWTMFADGQALAMLGCGPCGQMLEIWFTASAALARHPKRIAILRALLVKSLHFLPEFDLVVRIFDRNAEGQRMARFAGFWPTMELLTEQGPRTWLRPGSITQQAAAALNFAADQTSPGA